MNEEYLTYDDVNIVPRYSEISSRSNVDISTKLCGHHLDIPVIASPMESVVGINMQEVLNEFGATCTLPRFDRKSYKLSLKCSGSFIPSIGVDNVESSQKLNQYEEIHYIDTILIDVAHGHHEKVKATINYVKDSTNLNIIAGNVATPEAAVDLIKWGADAIRVGVGSGSVCTTRMKTGVGVPMISCIRKIWYKLYELARRDTEYKGIEEEIQNTKWKKTSIIADGGMKKPGDIAKALAAGADAVMLGSMLAGTDEAPGEIIEVDGQKMKKYYGSASREQKGNNNYVEGVSELIPYKGSVVDILGDIKDGLQSAFSYVGASDLEEFHENAELIKVSQNGHTEGKAHI